MRPGTYSDYSYVLNKSSPRVITPFVLGIRAVTKNMTANKENELVISAGVGEYSGQCGTYLINKRATPSCLLHNI